MHAAVRQVVQAVARGGETLPEESLESILREHWLPAGFSDPVQAAKYWEMGRHQLTALRQFLLSNPFDLLAQERTFQFAWGGTKVTGRIDQINLHGGRTGGKSVEVVEYKSGRPQTQKDADSSRQLTLYAKACREVLGLEPMSLILYNLATGDLLRTDRRAEDYRDLEEELIEASAAILAGKFAPLPGYYCRHCDFRAICPAKEEARGLDEAGVPK